MTVTLALAFAVAGMTAAAAYWAAQAVAPYRDIARIRRLREEAKAAARKPPAHAPAVRLVPTLAPRPVAPQFPDPPLAIQSFPPVSGRTAVYVKQPTSSLDWAGADWASPTALSFEQSTVTAETMGMRITLAREQPIPPAYLVADLEHMWRRLIETIRRDGYVVDRGQVLGVTIGGDFIRDQGSIGVRWKCWPAVAGVTTPRKDVTW